MLTRKTRYFLALLLLLLARVGFAADVRWLGGAQPVAQVTTIAVTGTWATNDTASVTCGTKTITVTIGSSVTTSDVASAVAAAINAADATTDLVNDETRNNGGQEFGEFRDVVASSSTSTLTLTSAVPGTPFTVTVSESTAGTGALGSPTEATPATGPNHANNADNWEGGNLPVTGDTLVFDSGGSSVLYGLAYFRDNTINHSLKINNDWSGQLGLPQYNQAGGYPEYRDRYWEQRGSSGFTVRVSPAVRTNPTVVGNLYIDFQGYNVDEISILANRGTLNTTATPSIYLAGGLSGAPPTGYHDHVRIQAGGVYIDPPDANVTTNFVSNDIVVGQQGANDSNCTVWIGDGVYLASTNSGAGATGWAITQYSGNVYCYASTDDGAGSTVAIEIYGGTWHTLDTTTQDDYVYHVYTGGTLSMENPDAKNIATVNLLGGTLDGTKATKDANVDVLAMYSGATLNDPAGNTLDIIDLYGCGPADVTLNIPKGARYTVGTLP